MSIKLVVTDLDGTLLTSDKKVSPRAMRAIEAMRERGVHFTIATGRNTASAAGIIRRRGLIADSGCSDLQPA